MLTQWLSDVAFYNNTSLELVRQQWLGYCANCKAFDQSPARDEFLRWYDLGSF